MVSEGRSEETLCATKSRECPPPLLVLNCQLLLCNLTEQVERWISCRPGLQQQITTLKGEKTQQAWHQRIASTCCIIPAVGEVFAAADPRAPAANPRNRGAGFPLCSRITLGGWESPVLTWRWKLWIHNALLVPMPCEGLESLTQSGFHRLEAFHSKAVRKMQGVKAMDPERPTIKNRRSDRWPGNRRSPTTSTKHSSNSSGLFSDPIPQPLQEAPDFQPLRSFCYRMRFAGGEDFWSCKGLQRMACRFLLLTAMFRVGGGGGGS